jgi:hypothetical protein
LRLSRPLQAMRQTIASFNLICCSLHRSRAGPATISRRRLPAGRPEKKPPRNTETGPKR